MSELIVMDLSGDSKTVWDPDNADEVAAAQKTFIDLKAKGYLAYEVKRKGKPGKIMDKFDPEAGAVIMSPPMAGG
jgi:hypothetical protein